MTHNQHNKAIEKGISDKVNEYGWQISLIESDGYNPSFAYTIGLFKTFSHPELIIFGLGTKLMAELLNIAGEKIKKGQTIQLDMDYDDFLVNYNCRFIKVNLDYYPDYLGYGSWFNRGNNYEVYQLVWPNKQGNFPWNKGDDEQFDFRQPLLDRKMDFKYLEPDNLAIFTTKFVLNLERPILEVYHETDGDWQFLCGTTNEGADLKLICLKDIVKLDNSVNELFNLGFGEYAWRQNRDDKWKRDKIKNNSC